MLSKSIGYIYNLKKLYVVTVFREHGHVGRRKIDEEEDQRSFWSMIIIMIMVMRRVMILMKITIKVEEIKFQVKQDQRAVNS